MLFMARRRYVEPARNGYSGANLIGLVVDLNDIQRHSGEWLNTSVRRRKWVPNPRSAARN